MSKNAATQEGPLRLSAETMKLIDQVTEKDQVRNLLREKLDCVFRYTLTMLGERREKNLSEWQYDYDEETTLFKTQLFFEDLDEVVNLWFPLSLLKLDEDQIALWVKQYVTHFNRANFLTSLKILKREQDAKIATFDDQIKLWKDPDWPKKQILRLEARKKETETSRTKIIEDIAAHNALLGEEFESPLPEKLIDKL